MLMFTILDEFRKAYIFGEEREGGGVKPPAPYL